jgi:hypothetical protein
LRRNALTSCQQERDMAAFTPERRTAENRAMIPPSGDRRRAATPFVNPVAEEAYWRANYLREPYYERGYTFEDYFPAYRTGWEGRARYAGRTYEQAERELQRDYARNRGASQLEWSRNRHAVRAAWERFDHDEEG